MKRLLFTFILIFCFFASHSLAGNVEGTRTYEDYLFVLVHGFHASEKTYDQGLKGYLEKSISQGGMGLEGHVYAYSFSNPDGSVVEQARELGDRNYDNPAAPMNQQCWLERAREDFKVWYAKQHPPMKPDDVPTSEVPSKYILLTHSMGNFAARAYIYSDYMSGKKEYYGYGNKYYEKGFYEDDVAKVVMVAPTLLGTDMVFYLWWTYKRLGLDANKPEYWVKAKEFHPSAWSWVLNFNSSLDINEIIKGAQDPFTKYFESLQDNPFAPYQVAADISTIKLMQGLQASDSQGDGTYKLFDPFGKATQDLMPYSPVVTALSDASLPDQTKEPAYSIVYGQGVPVFDATATLVMEGVRTLNRNYLKSMVENAARDSAMRGSDYFDYDAVKEGNLINQTLNLDYNLLTLMYPRFWALSTSQAKFYSLLGSRLGNGFFTQDGDGFVDVTSAKGGVNNEEVAALKTAKRYPWTYKTDHFENYLNEQFPQEIAITEAAIATIAGWMQMGGTPYPVAWKSLWWLRIPLAVSLLDKVYYNSDGIVAGFGAHQTILKQYDIISTAILDTPAIFTVRDLQTTDTREVESTSVMAFTAPTPEANWQSIKVNSVKEDRHHAGFANMPFPSTLDGDRKYITTITVTKAPERILGKLNYIIPRKMKQFEFSFNFAAWKPIENVNPETGEFSLDGLPFAEGQNVLAVRATNAVGINSNQLLKIILNTIPMVASELSPLSGSHTNNNRPTWSAKFGKAGYSSEKIESIQLKSGKLGKWTVDGEQWTDVTNEMQIENKEDTYGHFLRFSYTPKEPLPDGHYSLVVEVESNVGVSQVAMDLVIDTTAPAIAIQDITPYSTRAPTTIKYTSSDEASPNLRNFRCELYDSNDNFVKTIATAESLSLGDNFTNLDGAGTPDGDYKIRISAFDLADNACVATTDLTIDSTAPAILGAAVDPLPVTSNTSSFGLTTRVNEKANVIIKLINTTKNETSAYLAQAQEIPEAIRMMPGMEHVGSGFLATQNWQYDNMFAPGPTDGNYRCEVVAMDDAGNQSAPVTLESLVIDRTPPVISGQICQPYVLANSGANAYKTTLTFNVNDEQPSSNDELNTKNQFKVKVKMFNSNTGKLVNNWTLTTERKLTIDASDPTLFAKGSYKLQIAAEDQYGNLAIAETTCVKDGIAPTITFPAKDETEVSGTIAIRGTAIDPDWTNDLAFKNYQVFISAKGQGSRVIEEAIEVPLVNRGNSNTPKNTSLRPLQNDSTLAYLHTNLLENGEYTIKVVVNEERGESLVAIRTITVKNDSTAEGPLQPYVKLSDLPGDIEFKTDDSVKLPIRFLNSVKPANVYVEVVNVTSNQYPVTSIESTVFSKYFANVQGAPFVGEPEIKSGELGYFFWQDDFGYHLRWRSDGSSHKFTGSLVAMGSGGISNLKLIGSGITPRGPLVSWDTNSEGGFDFTAETGQLMLTPKIDEDPNDPDIYAKDVYLGAAKQTQTYLPIMVDVAGGKLVNLGEMGSGKSDGDKTILRSSPAASEVEWNGRLETGSYADSGTYIVRVRAEGVDGQGVAGDERVIRVKTPYDFNIAKVSPADKEFSTTPPAQPDRISVFYSVSKDSVINATVYDGSGRFVGKILENEEVLGVYPNNPYSLSWQGNYPDPDSGTLVGPGNYTIRLSVSSKDGTETRTADISGIKAASFTTDNTQTRLEPIGQQITCDLGLGMQQIRLAGGDSPFYLEAKGRGTYYPPKDFNYQLTASGTNRITAYPYVPFAGLMHRGFREVDTKVKAKFRVSAWNWEQGVHKDIVVFGYKVGEWYDPIAWGVRLKTVYQERWIEKDDLPNGSKGAVFKQGNEYRTYYFDFDPDNFWHQSDWDNFWGKPTYGSAITSIDVQLEVFSKDGSFTLDITPDDIWVTREASSVFEKGVFAVANSGSEYKTNHTSAAYDGARVNKEYGAYKIKLDLNLEAPIAYSRLTNRFVPWIGFVRNGIPAHEDQDFSGYLNKLDKLGFPGSSYFIGEPAKAPDAPHRGKFTVELFPGNTGSLVSSLSPVGNLNVTEPKIAEITNESSSKMTGTANDYTTYLSQEYLEFIPITSPLMGKIEYQGKEVSGRIELSPKEETYPFIASTSLVFPSAGNDELNISSPFEMKWPLEDKEISDEKIGQQDKRKKLDPLLDGNPQDYSGPSLAGTWWDLDTEQIDERKKETKNTYLGGGKLLFKKSVGKSVWPSGQTFGSLLEVPKYVNELVYKVEPLTDQVSMSPVSGGMNSEFSAEDLEMGRSWTTADDSNLVASDGLLKSGPLTFNENNFRGSRTVTLADHYDIVEDTVSPAALKYTFLKSDQFGRTIESRIDNPNLVISGWDVSVKNKTGRVNDDLTLVNVNTTADGGHQAHIKQDSVELKLKLKAPEARFVEITGVASGPYEVMFFDGKDKNWQTIEESYASGEKTGHLAWWNVSRLNGKYTVLIKSQGLVATEDIYIGTVIGKAGGDAWSAYKRAQLRFPARAFGDHDQLVTITPVTMTEIKVRNRPILMTHGPIVEIKPSPWKFETTPEDKRPTLRFIYTFDELKDEKVWNGVGEPANIPWNIHQVTAAGDLQIVDDNLQSIENNNGEDQYVFSAPLDHFSTYTLLNGKFNLSAPIVLASRYITNQETVTVYGTAEPGSVVTCYVKLVNEAPDTAKAEPYAARLSADPANGTFKFENVQLLQEGDNFIFVTSHNEGSVGIRTQSDLKIVKDTIAPTPEVTVDRSAFSPNNDGRLDDVNFELESNEQGKINLVLTNSQNRNLYTREIQAGRYEQIKLVWRGDNFDLFRKAQATGLWTLVSSDPAAEKVVDGLYQAQIFAIDEAGNISANIIKPITLDTTPPVAGNKASLAKFSPNGDGRVDSEQWTVNSNEKGRITYELKNLRTEEQGIIFRDELKNEANVKYSFEWDHEKLVVTSNQEPVTSIPYSANLVDGVYTFEVVAVDEVENRSPPVTAEVVVDLTAPELLTFSASPEYFSPNGDGIKDFTTINYELNESAAVSLEAAGKVLPAGAKQWNGQGVKDGQYYIQLTAEDEVGNRYDSARHDKNVAVVVDTVAPAFTVKPNLYAISPNGDGEYDMVEYEVKSSEKGEGELNVGARLFAESLEENKAVSFVWDGSKNPDGLYTWEAFAVDRAGNKSKVVSGPITVDTTPPVVITATADPNPFTPNDDGVNDTTVFSSEFSEPVYLTLNIQNDKARLFRKMEWQSKNFAFPTTSEAGNPILRSSDDSRNEVEWDGRGSHNELIGGEYSWSITARDWVGNKVISDPQVLVVDREPTLLPYAYAEPDPFAPKNPQNSFTEIKYYVGRDGLLVNVWIAGREEQVLQSLVKDEVQNKGEHAVRWAGEIADGSYVFVVTASDPNEPGAKAARVSGTVLADNIPPQIVVKGLAVDYDKNLAVLTYHIPENSSVEVVAYDVDGNLLGEALKAYQESGEHSFTYDFGGEQEQAAQRYLKVIATDRAKNQSEIKTTVFSLSRDALRINNLAVLPAVFTPNNDSRTDQTRISYAVSGGKPGYVVSVAVLSAGGATVKHLIDNEPQGAGNYSYYWDGSTSLRLSSELRRTVDDDYYQVVVTVKDQLGAIAAAQTQVLLVSTRPSLNLSISQSYFSPNNDQSQDTNTFNYSLSYPVKFISGEGLVKLEVLNASSEAVWSKIFNQAAGSYVYEFGEALPAGQYTVKATGQDALGTTAQPRTQSFVVDYTPSAITSLAWGPDPFSPPVKNDLIIDYQLAETAFVKLDVRNRETNQETADLSPQFPNIANLIDGTALLPAGQQQVKWDGSEAPDGIYLLDFTVRDRAGNHFFVSREVEVDQTNPNTPTVLALSSHTNEVELLVRGTAEPKARLDLYVNDLRQRSVTVEADGTFIVWADLALTENEIKVTATDAAFNESDYSIAQSVLYETDKPVVSNVRYSANPVQAKTLFISFEVSETLLVDPIVTINGNLAVKITAFSLLLAPIPTSGPTAYSYEYQVTNADQQGLAEVKIQVVDLAHNLSISQSLNLSLDTVQPIKPIIYDLPEHTNLQKRQISGEAEPNSTIKFYRSGRQLAELTADQTGHYSKVIDLILGSNIIEVVSIDSAGNQSETALSGQVIYDTVEPVFSDLQINPDPAAQGLVRINFTVSKPLSSPPVVTTNTRLASLESENGLDYVYHYQVNDADPQGQTLVEISGIDLAGNDGSNSADFVVDTIFPERPELLTLPAFTNEAELLIKGTAEPKSRLALYVNNFRQREINVAADGQFNVWADLALAKNELKVTATDAALNTSAFSAAQTVLFDTDLPVISKIRYSANPVQAKTLFISFEVSETLLNDPIVTINGNLAVKNTAYSLLPTAYIYEYQVTNTDQQGQAEVAIQVTDLANNTAEKKHQQLVIDTIQPVKPIIYELPAHTNVQKRQISGEAEPNTVIKFYRAGKQLAELTADQTGHYSKVIDLVLGSNIIEVVSIDSAGNQSETAEASRVIYDVEQPAFSEIEIVPDPAAQGVVSVSFNVSEPLLTSPQVTTAARLASLESVNGLAYVYQYQVQDTDPQGETRVEISGIDLAGNSGGNSAEFMVDTIYPQVTAQPQVNPFRAKVGKVNLDFGVSETLKQQPTVKINGRSANFISLNGSQYHYEYQVTSADQQGQAVISIETIDFAGNTTSQSYDNLILDTIQPVVSSVEVSPPIAKAGLLTINFVVSETLAADPQVTINGKSALLAPIPTSGSTAYSYEYQVANTDQQGLAKIEITVEDLAHNLSISQSLNLLTIDTIQAAVSNIEIRPLYARLSSEVTVDFDLSEPLFKAPTVYIGNNLARQVSSTTYVATIDADDAEGTTLVSIEVEDLAHNLSIFESQDLTVDKTYPAVVSYSVSPNPASTPAVNGQVAIDFTVSEALSQAPQVIIAQHGADPQSLPVTGYGLPVTNGLSVKYDVITGYDGTAIVSIETTDLAGNVTTQTYAELLIDTIPPVVSNIESEISGNTEFHKFAREGSEATIRFDLSEALKFNPEVKVNDNPAVYDGLANGEYIYKYTIQPTDLNGNATIEIHGYDFALNEVLKETSTSAESFVIDLENPTVLIASQSALIANPASFATNTNPDGVSDRPRSTALLYQLAEPLKTTVKVYKMPDDQTTYVKEDFNETNYVTTLVDNVWQNANEQQTVIWRGRDQAGDYAQPGKYAFIVEGRDRANNLTLRKWGGTVWIQNNVLTLREPEQIEYEAASLEVEHNPDPAIISPNGNSGINEQLRARYYFMIDLSINPYGTKESERIEALKVIQETKKIGYYSSKIYSDAVLTNLVRVVTEEADAWAGTLIWDDWNGKDDSGQWAVDGTYYAVIEVKDFAGDPAVNNRLTRQVVVDNTPPELKNLAVSDYYFAPGSSNSTIETTTISYDVSDNLSTVAPGRADQIFTSIEILHNGSVEALIQTATQEGGTYSKVWAGEGTVGGDGEYIYRISAVDRAGNTFEATGTAIVDRLEPTGTIEAKRSSGVASEYTNSESVNLVLSADDANLVNMQFSNEDNVWSSLDNYGTNRAWTLTGGDALKTVSVKYWDRAGNWREVSDTIKLDKTAPLAPILGSGETAWSSTESFSVDWTNPVQDAPASPIVETYYRLGGGAIQSTTSKPFSITATAQGGQTLKLWLLDEAGNASEANYVNLNLRYDITPPNTPNVSVSGPAENAWSNNPALTLTWGDPGDGGGSGVASYQSTVDGGLWTAVNSGWSTSLADGTHNIKVRAVDNANNSGSYDELVFNIDTVRPDGAASPNSRSWGSGPISVVLTASDDRSGVASRQYQWTNDINTPSSWLDFSNGDTVTQSGDGTWYLHYKIRDNAGNEKVGRSLEYYKDGVAPTISFGGQAADTWYSPDNAITISCADTGGSGYRGYKMQWDNPVPDNPSGCIEQSSGSITHSSEGPRTLYVRVWDWAGNTTTDSRVYMRDATAPTATFGGQAADTWYSPDNAITIDLSDAGGSGYRGYKWSWDSWPSDDPSGCNTASSGSTNHGGQGGRTLYVRVWDNVGNRTDVSRTYYRDSVGPSLTDLVNKTFNPYVDFTSGLVDFSAPDPEPKCGGDLTFTAQIKSGTTVIKDLTVIISGMNSVSWNGQNNSGDYVNEGDYTLEITASDRLGNSTIKTSTISVKDDQRITNSTGNFNSPHLSVSVTILDLKWLEGGADDSRDDQFSPVHAYVDKQWWESGWSNWVGFNIDHDQEVLMTLDSQGNDGDRALQWDVDDSAHTTHEERGLSNPHRIWMTAGAHRIRCYVGANAFAGNRWTDAYAYFKDRKYNQYNCLSSSRGQMWGSITGPTQVDEHPAAVGDVEVASESDLEGSYQYYLSSRYGVSISGNQVLLTKYYYWSYSTNFGRSWRYGGGGNDGVIQMSFTASAKRNPTIAVDNDKDLYIAWEDNRDGNWEIYFQQIPANFAPRKTFIPRGGVYSLPIGDTSSIKVTALEVPALISPTNNNQVPILRPTFKWKHRRGDTVNYQLKLAKMEGELDTVQPYTKPATAGSPISATSEVYNYTYSIHEFEPGLDSEAGNNTYFWKVTALSTNEAATSETWSFTVTPAFTLTGVTNWPNPFNPNSEKTKLRYRLGADAEEVKIRIYDITGSLVREIEGTTRGESSSIWDKYNDVEWDGKNGRGDMVMNGIYPFEIVARSGGRSVSGRGKIAVLK